MKNNFEQLNQGVIQLNKRLGVIISLLLRRLPKKGSNISLKEQVEILSGFGIRPCDIADILGRTSTYINKELVGLRKERHKKHE